MKNLKIYYSIILLLWLFSMIIKPINVSAWGDSNGGRPSYTIDQINQGVLGDKIVFNSISDGVIGDEKNFVGARENTGINAGKDNVWNGSDINVENGKEYLVRLYVHNNNPKGMDAVAEDTHVSFNIPQESAKDIQINGFIKADNADPQEYWDYVNFHSDTAFHLEYVYGSAKLENNVHDGNEGGLQLSDDIIQAASGGILFGYDEMNGRVPGCFQYASYITIRVKAVYDTDYTVTKQVRIKGDTDKTWKDSVDAKIGDEVEFKIQYVNTSDHNQIRVGIRDILPSNLEYVPGSTILLNANHPKGAKVNSDEVVGAGIAIGDYAPGANGVVYLNAKVVDQNLACGKNTMTNWGQAIIDQTGMQDWARVVVWKEMIQEEKWSWLHGIGNIFMAMAILSLAFTMILYCRKHYLQKKIEFLETEIKRLNPKVGDENSEPIKKNQEHEP